MGVGGQRHAPAALPPLKTRYPFYMRLGGSQRLSRRLRKISPLTGIRFPDRPPRSESLYRLSHRGEGSYLYRGADKSLARPGRKQASLVKSVMGRRMN